MSGYMNRAAADSWIEAGPSIKARLEQIFAESGQPLGTVDRWTKDIVRNTCETAPSHASPLPVVSEACE
ncbi:hypothetical protein D3C71_156650 [compost metagenome]